MPFFSSNFGPVCSKSLTFSAENRPFLSSCKRSLRLHRDAATKFTNCVKWSKLKIALSKGRLTSMLLLALRLDWGLQLFSSSEFWAGSWAHSDNEPWPKSEKKEKEINDQQVKSFSPGQVVRVINYFRLRKRTPCIVDVFLLFSWSNLLVDVYE